MFNIDKYRSRVQEETGFSMLISLLTLIVLISIVTSVAFMTVMITQKSAQTRDYSYYTLTADSVSNEVLMLANSTTTPLPSKPSIKVTGLSNYVMTDAAAKATDGLTNGKVFKGTSNEFNQATNTRELRYFWYVTDASTTIPFSSYVLNVGVYSSPEAARTLSEVKQLDKNAFFSKTRINSIQVIDTMFNSDEEFAPPTYIVPNNDIYTKGLVGWESVSFTGHAQFRSYDSAVTLNPQAVGATLSENTPITVKGNLSFPPSFAEFQTSQGTTGGHVTILSKDPDATDPSACFLGTADNRVGPCPLPSTPFPIVIGVKNDNQENEDINKCLNSDYFPEVVPMTWSTATNGTVLPAGPTPALLNNVLCLNSLDITEDTVLNPSLLINTVDGPVGTISTGNPLYVVVKGPITISNGAVVNKATSPSTGPTSLRIVVNHQGDALTMTSLDSTKPTTLNALVRTRFSGNCSFSSPAANPAVKTILNGAISCNTITTSGTFNYNFDTQINQLPVVNSLQNQTYRLYYDTSSSPVASL